jgi:hypothetical protein
VAEAVLRATRTWLDHRAGRLRRFGKCRLPRRRGLRPTAGTRIRRSGPLCQGDHSGGGTATGAARVARAGEPNPRLEVKGTAPNRRCGVPRLGASLPGFPELGRFEVWMSQVIRVLLRLSVVIGRLRVGWLVTSRELLATAGRISAGHQACASVHRAATVGAPDLHVAEPTTPLPPARRGDRTQLGGSVVSGSAKIGDRSGQCLLGALLH